MMISNFQEYVKAANEIENNKLEELRELRKQLTQKIIQKDETLKMEDIWIRVDLDCCNGDILSRKKINLKSMEEELHILVNREDKVEHKFYDDEKERTSLQYIYYFDIYYD